MLIKKAIIYLNIFTKRINNNFFLYQIYYNPCLIIGILVCVIQDFFKKYNPILGYLVNFKVLNVLIFNSCIIYVVLLFRNLNLNFRLKFNFFKQKQITYTLLRSAFVHKTSREQLCLTTIFGRLFLEIGVLEKKNSVTIYYFDQILGKLILKLKAGDRFIKRQVFLRKI